ncbi:hypothetical protein SDC9_170296 [bioreactor metagenome]|uniref:Uncharacterized protein n=1 Tax=bioreactor metagenome TaxID=1076179 RepID=A0A645G7N7_9ZZZZ
MIKVIGSDISVFIIGPFDYLTVDYFAIGMQHHRHIIFLCNSGIIVKCGIQSTVPVFGIIKPGQPQWLWRITMGEVALNAFSNRSLHHKNGHFLQGFNKKRAPLLSCHILIPPAHMFSIIVL